MTEKLAFVHLSVPVGLKQELQPAMKCRQWLGGRPTLDFFPVAGSESARFQIGQNHCPHGVG